MILSRKTFSRVLKTILTPVFSVLLGAVCAFGVFLNSPNASAANHYVPTKENLQARKAFSNMRLGIFLHWGIYATYAQGEWYLNSGLKNSEYSKAASCFYPVKFDANRWCKAFKDAGAGYVCMTSRHHDGFSMFDTDASDYNIVDATPFKRDVIGEMATACKKEHLKFHIYYSILDWIREDYPVGRTGHNTGRKGDKQDYNSYFNFMKAQMKELLTNYGPIGAIWLDGYWDQDENPNFDWRMPEFYEYIHSIQPACLIGNNHHISPIEGEDFQMFERDLPGENEAGLSGQDISNLPLEMCQTMNGMWGYKVADLNYKSVEDLVEMIVRAAAKNSNLLLNIGPRPNGELPDLALERLEGIGRWMKKYGGSVYGTEGCDATEGTDWAVCTRKGNTTFVHIFSKEDGQLELNIPYSKVFPKTNYKVSFYKQCRTGKVEVKQSSDKLQIRIPNASGTEHIVLKVVSKK